MTRKLLDAEERDLLLRIPTDETNLYRIYTIPPREQAFIRRALEPHTMMDRALHLSLLKWPGTGFQLGQTVPPELVAFVAKQLNLSVRAFRAGGRIGQAHTRTARDAAIFLGWRTVSGDDIPMMVDLAAGEAAHTDSGFKIVSAVLNGLRKAKIIIPAWDTIERAAVTGLTQARESAIETVLVHLTPKQKGKLDRLVINDLQIRQSRLAWLRNVKEPARVTNLQQLIERRQYLLDLAIPLEVASSITPWQYQRLIRRGNRARPQDIADYANHLRHAVLAAQVLHLLRALSDGGVDMFNTLTVSVFNDTANRSEKQFLDSKPDSIGLAQAYHELVRAVQAIEQHGVEAKTAVDSTLGWDYMLQLDDTAVAFSSRHGQDTLVAVCENFARFNKFVPGFLKAFAFSATNPKNPLLTAISIVREAYEKGKQSIPSDAPVSFLSSPWQQLVKVDGKIDRKRYITAVTATMRDRLRSGDLHVEGTNNYKPFDEYLVPVAQVPALLHRLPFDTNVKSYLGEREEYLRERLVRFSESLLAEKLEGVHLVNGRISVTPLVSTIDAEVERIGDKIDRVMPRKQLSEVFHQLHADTGVFDKFCDAEGRPHHDVRVVMAALWALASGIGLERMADASPGITLGQLEWAAANFITEETLDRAIASLVNHQTTLPFARYGGDGTSSSSDGQFVAVGRRAAGNSGYNPKYGPAPGVKIYTHINDQCMAYHTRVLSANAPEAPYVLDGIIFHGSDLVIKEHVTDTGGASDHVFAGCRVADVSFMPRYRDAPDLKFGYIGSSKPYTKISGLLGRRIRTTLIEEYWPDITRLGVSFMEGVVRPSIIFRRLAAFRQQNQFAAAWGEFGRIERSIFMIDWLERPDIRHDTQVDLNRGESQHFLSDAIRLNNHGRLLDRTQENQTLRAKAAAFVTVAIVCSNTSELDPAVKQLAANGQPIAEEILRHISPLGWKHITLTGQYFWDRPRKTKAGNGLLLPRAKLVV